MVLLISLSFTSCGGGDDDDEPEAIDDYFSIISDVTGGGLTNQESVYYTNTLNSALELDKQSWQGVSKSTAIYYAGKEADLFAKAIYESKIFNGIGNGSSIKVIYELKQRKTGSTIRKWTMTFTGSSYDVN